MFDDVCVMIPWRPTQSRRPLYSVVDRWYRKHLGIVPIAIDSGPDYNYFNLSNARNRAVEAAPKKIIVLTDADSIPTLDVLIAAIDGVRDDYRAHIPYSHYRTITHRATADVQRGRAIEGAAYYFEIDNAVSGVQVTTREIWESHNGQDERFAGWGFEDVAWWEAHTTLVDAPVRHPGILYALSHSREWKTEEATARNGSLVWHYLEAKGDPDRMKQIVFGPDPRIGTDHEIPSGPLYARPGSHTAPPA